jgi:hypothetical protein
LREVIRTDAHSWDDTNVDARGRVVVRGTHRTSGPTRSRQHLHASVKHIMRTRRGSRHAALPHRIPLHRGDASLGKLERLQLDVFSDVVEVHHVVVSAHRQEVVILGVPRVRCDGVGLAGGDLWVRGPGRGVGVVSGCVVIGERGKEGLRGKGMRQEGWCPGG